MKKILVLLVLATSTTVNLCAQYKTVNVTANNTDKTFEPPENSITRRFVIDLGKGNKLQLEVSALEDLDRIKNIDSLVKVFLHDLQPLKDSLTDELSAKRIDYTTDVSGRKKIHIQQYQPKGSSFLVDGNDVAAMKLEQDTVNISGSFPGKAWGSILKKGTARHYYRILFFVNQLSELPGYLDGSLNEKISLLEKEKSGDWGRGNDRQMHFRKDNSISAKLASGYFSGPGDYLELGAGINIQNYKNYFVPSFNLGAKLFVGDAHYKYEIGVAWEPYFLFAKNSAGNLQTFRNDFVTLTLGMAPVTSKAKSNEPHFDMFQHLTIGYLVRQKGNIIDNHTFRIGTGGIDWMGGKIKLEPILYFHDFFKNVTPGVRLSLSF